MVTVHGVLICASCYFDSHVHVRCMRFLEADRRPAFFKPPHRTYLAPHFAREPQTAAGVASMSCAASVRLRPTLLLTLRLLTLLESNFPGNSLWAWEFHPLELRLCLSQTL